MNCTKEYGMNIVKTYAKKEFNRIQNVNFPYPIIKNSSCINELKSLLSSQKSIKTSSSLVKRFHLSLNAANRIHHLSSILYWEKIKNDFNEFKRFYFNRLTRSDWYKRGDNRKYLEKGFVPDRIYYCGFTTSGYAPIPSYFKPMLAKYLINKYLFKYKEIFDPFSGFSGRMLGAFSENKSYIGFDINKTTVDESNNLIKYIKNNGYEINAHISVGNALSYKGKYDCLLTCPPYGDKEKWNQKIKILSCDEWIKICLDRFSCRRYVFVVDDTLKYKKYIKETLKNTSHFSSSNEYVVMIDK